MNPYRKLSNWPMFLKSNPSGGVLTIQAFNEEGDEWVMTVKECDAWSAVATMQSAGYDDITIAGGWHTWP